MKTILIIGPFPKPITGMSLANQVVKEILDDSSAFKVSVINTSYVKFDEKLGEFSFQKVFFYLKFNFKLYKIFQNKIIYITPGQTFFGVVKYFLFIVISSLLGKEIVIHIHGNHLNNEYRSLKGFKKKIVHFLVSKSTKGIVLSESLKGNMTPFIKEENIYVLHNFSQDYLISEDSKVASDRLRIVFLSNLMVEKGILELLKALKLLEDCNVSYEAKIAGNIDSENRDKIKYYLSKLKNTTYIGVVYGEQKMELLTWSTVFILPTYYKMEGQPISILEAMATNNVIVTTKHAGIPDVIIEGENGYFVGKKNVESIVNILKYLNENKLEIKRISNNNKIKFQENFTINHFKQCLIEILNA